MKKTIKPNFGYNLIETCVDEKIKKLEDKQRQVMSGFLKRSEKIMESYLEWLCSDSFDEESAKEKFNDATHSIKLFFLEIAPTIKKNDEKIDRIKKRKTIIEADQNLKDISEELAKLNWNFDPEELDSEDQ